MITAGSGSASILALLRAHPRVSAVKEIAGEAGISFSQGEWRRHVYTGFGSGALHGLIELMDNNPMVCADEVSVPSPVGTLALIAIGPLAEAGLVVEPPTILTNLEASEEAVSRSLESVGWTEGATIHTESLDYERVAVATVIVAIRTPDDISEIDDLFEERYGRSLYVRRDETSEWDTQLVVGQPFALYRLRIAQDEPFSLLTVQLMAAIDGKCGAAQLVHVMNVMSGFEESLGIS